MNQITAIIESLGLEKHCEGGYFKRTYCSDIDCRSVDGLSRKSMSSIYYLVTHELGFSALVSNKSDLMLYFHQGDPLTVVFVNEQGCVSEHVLGNDLTKGQVPQLLCPGGISKAYDLKGSDYALVSEAVSPSFVYEDMHQLTQADLKTYPAEARQQLQRYIIG